MNRERLTPVVALRDALSRVVRITEAVDDGEHDYARQLLDGLEHDLARMIEIFEIGGRAR